MSACASTSVASAAAAAFGATFAASRKCASQPERPALASAIPRSSSKAEALLGRRRLGEDAPQEGRLRLGRATLAGLACCVDQPLDDPGVLRRLADQQVLGDAFVGARQFGEQPGRSAVAPGAFGAGELGVDSAADDRVAEGQRPAGREDSGGHEDVCGVGSLEIVEVRQLARLEQVALLEDCECMRESTRVLGQPAKPQANRSTDAPGSDPLDVACGLRGRSDASFSQRVQEHTQ